MNNPYILAISSILSEVTGWGKFLVAGIAVVRIMILGTKYNQGDVSEKSDAVKGIKTTIYMGGGIFFLVWFAEYVITRFSTI